MSSTVETVGSVISSANLLEATRASVKFKEKQRQIDKKIKMEFDLVLCFFVIFILLVLGKVKPVQAVANYQKVFLRDNLSAVVYLDYIFVKNGKHGQVK